LPLHESTKGSRRLIREEEFTRHVNVKENNPADLRIEQDIDEMRFASLLEATFKLSTINKLLTFM
jgi:hypothetical protein